MSSKTHIQNRLKQKLRESDHRYIRQTLIEYIIKKDVTVEKLARGPTLVKAMCEGMSKFNPDWADMAEMAMSTSHTAIKKMYDMVLGLLRSPKKLQDSVDKEREE